MFKKNNLIFCFFVVLILSFNVEFVKAASNPTSADCSKTGTYALRGKYYNTYGTYRKYICLGKSKLRLAFCADKGKNAPKSNNAMKVNSNFANSTVCVAKNKKGRNLRKINNVSSSNLDCSSMVGFIIRAAKSKGWGNGKKYYGRTQRAIQSFLYDSGKGKWRADNSRYDYDYIYDSDEGLIPMAFKEYANNKNNTIPTDNSKLNITFSVNGNDYNMYYDNNGYYNSYKVTVKVQCEGECNGIKPTTVSLKTARQGTEICINGFADNNCSDTSDLTLIGNDTIKTADFYVRTDSKNPTTIEASADYTTKTGELDVVYADSVMYNRKANSDKVQKLIVYDLDEDTQTYGGEAKTFVGNITLIPKVVKKQTCDKIFNGYTKLNSGVNSVKDKICSSNVTNANDMSKSVAEYKNCSDSSVNVTIYAKTPDNKCSSTNVSVAVSLANYGYFKYGNVLGDDDNTKVIRRGSGFYLQKLSEMKNNISSGTYFINQVSWAYNTLFSVDNNLYFYISPTTNIHHNSNAYSDSSCSKYVGNVDYYVKSIMNKAIYSEFQFGNSNDYNNYLTNLSDDVFVTVGEDGSKRNVPAIVSSVIINGDGIRHSVPDYNTDFEPNTTRSFYYSFKTPHAYFKNSDRGINYTVKDNDSKFNNEQYTYGGTRYYTYNTYVDDKFPLNISALNSLSLIKGMKWTLTADCDIEFFDDECPPNEICSSLYNCESGTCYLNYRYRSISVSDPFPKATEKDDLPDNWKDWYWGNSSNQSRLRNTFSNRKFYMIPLNDSTISEINSNYGNSYITWDNIKNTGVSSFVQKFNSPSSGVNNVNSYCKLGQVPTSACDAYN